MVKQYDTLDQGSLSRRRFIQGAARLGIGAAAFPHIVPSSVLGAGLRLPRATASPWGSSEPEIREPVT